MRLTRRDLLKLGGTALTATAVARPWRRPRRPRAVAPSPAHVGSAALRVVDPPLAAPKARVRVASLLPPD